MMCGGDPDRVPCAGVGADAPAGARGVRCVVVFFVSVKRLVRICPHRGPGWSDPCGHPCLRVEGCGACGQVCVLLSEVGVMIVLYGMGLPGCGWFLCMWGI